MSPVPRTESLTLDLGAAQAVGKVRLLPRATSPELFPGEFTIDVSTDGDNWTAAVSETDYVGQSNVWYEETFSAHFARYVRIAGPSLLIGDARVQYYLQIAEFEVYKFRDVAGSTLTASSATCSTVLYNRFPAANAIDGDPDTFWSSIMSTVPRAESLTLDLGATQAVGKVRLLPRATSPELFPGEFTIDVSTDGDNWTQAVSETDYVGQSNVWYEETFSAHFARYVRIAGPSMLIGDGGNAGTAASYEARYSTSQITTETTWDAASGVTGEPAPEIAGTVQSMSVNTSALPAAARVYFAIRTTNQAAVESGISNSP